MDEKGNQFVWVPVADASVMYEESETDIPLYGNSGVTTKKYSKSEIISGFNRTPPKGTESGQNYDYKEPDLTNFDYFTWSYCTPHKIGYDSTVILGQDLVDEYDAIVTSVNSCKGFFVGRYELSKSGAIKGLVDTGDWYEIYARSKEINTSSNVHSTMILGCQWDVICVWLKSVGYDIDTSALWGNYKGVSTGPEGKPDYHLPTGTSEDWKACNIYDLAGNCLEWTQEVYGVVTRCVRGGYSSHEPCRL